MIPVVADRLAPAIDIAAGPGRDAVVLWRPVRASAGSLAFLDYIVTTLESRIGCRSTSWRPSPS